MVIMSLGHYVIKDFETNSYLEKLGNCFVCHRSRLHFLALYFALCGLTILVDHFKLYLYYELTQLLLIYNLR